MHQKKETANLAEKTRTTRTKRRMDFAKTVIERSQELPVVVDFWAPWCGPCRTLGPAIESLAAESGGRWELVKINVDENQDISQRYQVMSIPAVKMFHKGEVVADFVGALPKGQIQKWLDSNIPDPRRMKLQALLDALQGPEPDRALQQLTAFAAENADLTEARLRLAQAQVLEAPEVALPLLESLSLGPEELELAEDIRTLAAFQPASLSIREKPWNKS
jgi:putative thioredoxin